MRVYIYPTKRSIIGEEIYCGYEIERVLALQGLTRRDAVSHYIDDNLSITVFSSGFELAFVHDYTINLKKYAYFCNARRNKNTIYKNNVGIISLLKKA